MILSLCCVHLQEDNDFKELTLFTSHIVEILKSKPLATNVVEIEQDLYQIPAQIKYTSSPRKDQTVSN